MSHMYTTAILLAGGSGTRMRSFVAKQELCIAGESLLSHAARALQAAESVDAIVAVVREDEHLFAERELSGLSKLVCVVTGGADRTASAARGVAAVPWGTELVAIHDAARPLITPRDIDAVVHAAEKTGAAIGGLAVADTVKRIDGEGFVSETLDRSALFLAATPQVFRLDWYVDAMHAHRESVTDDCMLMEASGHRVSAVPLQDENRKITVPQDLMYAEFVIKKRGERQ